MDTVVVESVTYVTTHYPVALAVYGILSGVYMTFCAVAAFTKTDADDKWAAKLKVFFSLPAGKK